MLNKTSIYLVGGFNPSEKHESQLGWLFPIHGKITNVPNHQPDIYIYLYILFPFYFDLPLLCQQITGGKQFPEGFPSDAEFKWCSVVFLDFPHLFYFASNDAAFLEQRFSNPLEKWRLLWKKQIPFVRCRGSWKNTLIETNIWFKDKVCRIPFKQTRLFHFFRAWHSLKEAALLQTMQTIWFNAEFLAKKSIQVCISFEYVAFLWRSTVFSKTISLQNLEDAAFCKGQSPLKQSLSVYRVIHVQKTNWDPICFC
jgi:hypothetical protein